jgi:RimJ/RimL family protein N-acetyltransferase
VPAGHRAAGPAATVLAVDVQLVAVDELVLAALVGAATRGAAPDEVTPPLGDGWTPERSVWLRAYHRDRRAGLDGPRGEATWAVLVDGAPVGGARLRWTDEAGVADTGLWLTRSVRGAGVGRAALAVVLELAAQAGVRRVVAETAAANRGALAVLGHLGFTLGTQVDGRVRAGVATGGPRPRH